MMNEHGCGLPPLDAADLALLRDHVASLGLLAQVEAITSDAPLTVVSAGAGTGKTWTLAWRFVWTALTRTDVRNILTLTFTEKAASEMRSRIAALLAELEPALGSSPELSRRRAAASAALDQAYISTLHGFGARVIGEAGLSLPVEPSLRLLSDPEAEEFWGELSGALDRLDDEWFCARMDEAFSSSACELLNSAEAAQAVSLWGAVNVAAFAREFEGMMADFGQTPESVLLAADDHAEPARSLLERIVDRECAALADRWSDALDVDPAEFVDPGKKPGQLAQRLTKLREKWLARGFDSAADCRAFVAEAAEAVTNARGKLADALAEEMGMKLKDWRDKANKLLPFAHIAENGFGDEELRLRSLLIRLAWMCWRKWNAFRDARGSLTFSDMIALAKEALRRDPRYASRFAEVLVDEFQDTNDQQDELLTVIRRAAGARLFVVGDLKQSIYRFRHAEPALFEKYIREARDGGGRYILLSVSFRSGERVLDAVNDRFGTVWKRSLGEGLAVPYEPLESPRGLARAAAWIDERQKTGLPVCERLIEDFARDAEGETSENAGSVRDRLALRLALRLSALKEEGASVWDRDHLRPVSWGDMAVLTPTRSSYESLQRAFSLCAVPAEFTGSRSFYARTEIRDACALAAFLAEPDDAAALGGFLCSPFSGLTQNEAQALLPLLGSEPLTAVERACPQLAAHLRALARSARLRGPSAALASLLRRGDLLKNVHPRKRAGALANLRRAVQLLESYEAGTGASPVGAAAYLRRAMQRGAADPEASAESGGDTVKVMTIHASKGLEFPLVALFGLEHGSRASGAKSGISPSRELLAAASRYPDEWGGGECVLAKVQKRLEEQAEYEERQRLYYVALTRARDGIILCGTMPKSGVYDPENDRSLMSVESVAGAFVPPSEIIGYPQIDACRRKNSSDALEEAQPGPDVPLPNARTRLLKSLSATSFALWSMCPAAWRMTFRQNLDLSWNAGAGESELQNGGSGGAGLGNVAHWILSKWNFSDEDYLRILGLKDGHLRPEFRSVWRDPQAKSELAGFLQRFHSPDGERLLARLRMAEEAGTLHREFPFRLDLEGFDLAGAVDVFWIERDAAGEPARVCVRDYKTTRLPRDPARRKWMDDFYAAQLRFYAFALRRLFPQYAALELDLALWNLRSGEEQRLTPFDPDAEQALEAALREQAQGAAGGPWPANPARCAGCAYARSCVFNPSCLAGTADVERL